MRILISGSSGLLGTAISGTLSGENHEVIRLVRPEGDARKAKEASGSTARWDPDSGKLDGPAADGSDALVHLAGASIGEGRWTPARKNVLRSSRVDATRSLIANLAQLQRPPRVVVGASAIGYYGNRDDEALTETSTPGNDFLATLCRDWEAETQRAAVFGARVVNLRFGMILAARGGALPRMALPFRLGVGGRLGSGRQWVSWIALPDAVSAIRSALTASGLQGPVNAVSPNPVRNSEFVHDLAKALHRPAIFPAPAFALRLALGGMADGLLLASQRVVPQKLQQAGFQFAQPELPAALRQIFGSAQ